MIIYIHIYTWYIYRSQLWIASHNRVHFPLFLPNFGGANQTMPSISQVATKLHAPSKFTPGHAATIPNISPADPPMVVVEAVLLAGPPTFAMARRLSLIIIIIMALLVSNITIHARAAAAGSPESQALITFMHQLSGPHNDFQTWDPAKEPCSKASGNWAGVICNDAGNSVWGLQLENLGLTGTINLEPLASLPNFRTLSLMGNDFTGPFPNVSLLPGLKSVYLSDNRLEGEVPEASLVSVRNLKKLILSNNNLSGKIPPSLVHLQKLIELRLDGNRFVGPVPDLQGVQLLNVSYNMLSGPIPASLSKRQATSFSGNKHLCGPPLEQPCAAEETTTPAKTNNNSSSVSMKVMIALAATAAVVALVAICALTMIILRTHRGSSAVVPHSSIEAPAPETYPLKKTKAADRDHEWNNKRPPGAGEEADVGSLSGRLTFLRDQEERFELADLLRASAEVLGSGWFGSSYKAALGSGNAMVVKRYRQMNNVGKEEFQEHMRRLGRLSHPNLLPLVAYYYRKDEKLIITDFIPNASLAFRLHGNKSQGQVSLGWGSRLRIVKGVAKGMEYLYNELPGLITPHGHLKSSNVLLSHNLEPILSDYALIPVTNQENAHNLLVAYKSPEHRNFNRVTKKTDVWSFGILILEVLTGKFLGKYLQQNDKDIKKGGGANAAVDGDYPDLASWVASVAAQLDHHSEDDGDSKFATVFDKSMGFGARCQDEMVKLMRIGLECCEADVEKRLDIREAAERIKKLRDWDDQGQLLSDDFSL